MAAAVTHARYAPKGLLALEPKAFGLEFLIGASVDPPVADGLAVVNVCGPLAFSGFLFATYASLRERVRVALASEAHTVVLCFDSPGGDVAGCFDCARGIRADAEAAGKRLVAWVPSRACSAAYALAAACDSIVLADTAYVGSIGVIHELQSVTKADAAAGVRYEFVRSGAKKAYGNPHTEITDAALAETQAMVDENAAIFFDLVRTWRGIDPEPLEAGVLLGASAVKRGLADEVSTFDALRASLIAAGGIQAESTSSANAKDSDRMAKAEDKKDDEKKDDARAALQKAADGGDAKAKRALAAYDNDSDEDDKAKAEDEKKDDKAEFPKKDEKEDDKALAAASSLAASVAAQAAEIASLKAQAAERDAREQTTARAAFFAAHAGLPEALLKSLEALPLEQCKKIVESIPPQFKSQVPELGRGPAQGAPAGVMSREAFMQSDVARRMGLQATQTVVELSPDSTIQTFGVRRAADPKAKVA